MKLSVFFDLETTDTCFLGQILNYALIAVDEQWHTVSECCGRVHVSRLQLPSAGAILANRIDIMRHQTEVTQTEKDAALKISDFLHTCLDRSGSDVRLIGFNSVKFDVPFLRTTFYRNGIPAYPKSRDGKRRLINGDALLAAQKLVTSNEEFALISLIETDEGIKRKLTLQHLTQQLGILQGAQTHESRDDVLLTISLARVFAERFGIDVRSWSAYEALSEHRTVRTGAVFINLYPEYDTAKDRSFSATPVTLLDYAGNSALWINLFSYEEGKGRDAIFWKNASEGPLFIVPCNDSQYEHYSAIAKRAVSEFKHIAANNFFPRSTCDIEADVYRLDFNAQDELQQLIWQDGKKKPSSPDIKEIYTRNRLANYTWGSGHDEAVEKLLVEYASYRYGGSAIVKKFTAEDKSQLKHPALPAMYTQIQEGILKSSGEDRKLLESLRQYYLGSDIVRLLKKNDSLLARDIT